MFFTLTVYPNPIQATIQLLKQLKVKVTNTTISKTLEQHPDYPSLLSIHDALPQFNIDALAIDADKTRIVEFPLPFMAYTTIKGGSFVTVYAINNNVVSYYNGSEADNTTTTSLGEFNTIWTGKTLLVDAKPNAGEANYAQQQRKALLQYYQVPLLLLVLLLCGVLLSLNAFINNSLANALPYSLLMLLHFAGIVVSSLLLWYEVDKTNTTLQKICTAGSKTNCNAILNSKQSKFLGWLSWSEIGFYYFLGSYLSLQIIGMVALPVLAIFNFMALPYIIFSVYYQWQVAKQWCVLCLTVQALLLLQGITNGFSFHLVTSITINTISQFILAFILPIAIWALVKPSLLNNKELQPKAKELARLKANPLIFESLLIKQKQITQSAKDLGILIGNPNATNTIIKVCNPYCGPCAKAHPILEDILHHNPNVQLQVLFTATVDADDHRNKPVKHLLALQQLHGQSVASKAMDDWYNAPKKNYEIFAAKYPVASEIFEQQNDNVEDMKVWCENINIQYTPTFFINGYQLPEIYSIGDVKYLLS
ncbi:MAG: thioredoxin domain-containing protein [Deinococcales bacterium]|nr:thioredoxin domain-containing protein [Chitinophagaceae bacterium]